MNTYIHEKRKFIISLYMYMCARVCILYIYIYIYIYTRAQTNTHTHTDASDRYACVCVCVRACECGACFAACAFFIVLTSTVWNHPSGLLKEPLASRAPCNHCNSPNCLCERRMPRGPWLPMASRLLSSSLFA